MSKSIYNTLPSWQQHLINNPSDYIMANFEPDEWFDIVVNELDEFSNQGAANPMYGVAPWNKGLTGVQDYPTNKEPWNKGLTGVKTSSKGQIPWNKGKTGVQTYLPKSPETIARMSASAKKRKKSMYIP